MRKTTKIQTVIITHGGCPDGTAAAYVAKLAFPDAIIHYATVRNFDEDNNMPDLIDKNVIIVDYSYDKQTIWKLFSLCKKLTIYDHHESTGAELSDFLRMNKNAVNFVFDPKRCGAEIIWDELMQGLARPWWMKHIRDRDLWLWEHPDSEAFAEAFNSMGLSMKTMEEIDNMTPGQYNFFIQRGREICNHNKNIYNKLAQNAELVHFQGWRVYAINIGTFQSEIGNILASRSHIAFAVIYRYSPSKDRWFVSLRGGENCPNLAKIAIRVAEENRKILHGDGKQSLSNGGGHPKAAGFEYIGDFTRLLDPILVEDT